MEDLKEKWKEVLRQRGRISKKKLKEFEEDVQSLKTCNRQPVTI